MTKETVEAIKGLVINAAKMGFVDGCVYGDRDGSLTDEFILSLWEGSETKAVVMAQLERFK